LPAYADDDVDGLLAEARRSFRGDLGKRRPSFRGDLGKRDAAAAPWMMLPDADADDFSKRRYRFRGDLGKRRASFRDPRGTCSASC